MVYRQAKSPWLTTEPPVNWLTADRACSSNYAGRHCERIWIMSILPWWLPWKTRLHQGQVPPHYCTLSGPLAAPHTVPRWAQEGHPSSLLATSISEDPTEIELCKLHAMNSTRRGRIHAHTQPAIHSHTLYVTLMPPSTHPPVVLHRDRMRKRRRDGLGLGAPRQNPAMVRAHVLCC